MTVRASIDWCPATYFTPTAFVGYISSNSGDAHRRKKCLIRLRRHRTRGGALRILTSLFHPLPIRIYRNRYCDSRRIGYNLSPTLRVIILGFSHRCRHSFQSTQIDQFSVIVFQTQLWIAGLLIEWIWFMYRSLYAWSTIIHSFYAFSIITYPRSIKRHDGEYIGISTCSWYRLCGGYRIRIIMTL